MLLLSILSLHHFPCRLGPSHQLLLMQVLVGSLRQQWLARYRCLASDARRGRRLAVEDDHDGDVVVAMKGRLDAVDHESQLVIFSKYYSQH